jgi:hypothetical protein
VTEQEAESELLQSESELLQSESELLQSESQLSRLQRQQHILHRWVQGVRTHTHTRTHAHTHTHTRTHAHTYTHTHSLTLHHILQCFVVCVLSFSQCFSVFVLSRSVAEAELDDCLLFHPQRPTLFLLFLLYTPLAFLFRPFDQRFKPLSLLMVSLC